MIHSLTKWLAAPAIMFGAMLVGDASVAQAQHSGTITGRGSNLRFDTPGTQVRTYHYSGRSPYYRHGYGYPRYGYGYGYGYRYPHYHYHPQTIYRHGNHWHVQPGHFHLHFGH